MAHPLIHLFAVSLVCQFLGAPAQAQDWQTFDCRRLLKDTKFDDPALPGAQTKGIQLRLPTDSEVPTDSDPVSAQELLSKGERPLLARSLQQETETGTPTLGCSLIIVEFLGKVEFSGKYEKKLTLRDGQGEEQGNRIPIVLVDLFSNASEEEDQFKIWETNHFNVPTVLPFFSSAGSTDLTAHAFKPITYFRKHVMKIEAVRFVPILNAPEDVKTFLSANGADAATEMIVLCGAGDCQTIHTHLAEAAHASTVETKESTSVEEKNAASVVPQKIKPFTKNVAVTYVDPSGKESSAGLDTLGGLECILSAVSSDLFQPQPTTCDPRAFSTLKSRDALIRIGPEGRWQLVAGARFPNPRYIKVTLPLDQPDTSCAIDVTYVDRNNKPRTVELEPQGGTNPARFEAELLFIPIRVGDGKSVEFKLLPTPDLASCGGVGRTVISPAAEIVVIPLLAKAPLRRAILHTLLLNTEDLEISIGLDQNARRRVGGAILEAVEAAHARVAATRSDEAWALVAADVGALNETGQIEPVVRLSGFQLQEQVTESFAALMPGRRDQITGFRPRPTAERLKQALLPSVTAARDSGRIGELTVTLIAPVTGRSSAGLDDPCRDERFRTLPVDLKLPDGPDVKVAVFPLIRLAPGDVVGLANLSPLTQDNSARSLPGGLYACRDLPAGLAIYPFFLEPWRPSVDVASRYATALSDRIADLLDALVSNEEVSK